MPKYEKADSFVNELAVEVIGKWHKPLEDAGVRIDYLFAFADEKEDGEPAEPALTKDGHRVLGIARKLGPKDRAMGRGDCEILLDGDWWMAALREEQVALLDHELMHFEATADLDKQGRPKVKIRPHDVQIGWFNAVAARHQKSQERIQARGLMDELGQFYWPTIAGENPNLEELAAKMVRTVGLAGAKLVVNLTQHKTNARKGGGKMSAEQAQAAVDALDAEERKVSKFPVVEQEGIEPGSVMRAGAP